MTALATFMGQRPSLEGVIFLYALWVSHTSQYGHVRDRHDAARNAT